MIPPEGVAAEIADQRDNDRQKVLDRHLSASMSTIVLTRCSMVAAPRRRDDQVADRTDAVRDPRQQRRRRQDRVDIRSPAEPPLRIGGGVTDQDDLGGRDVVGHGRVWAFSISEKGAC